MRVPRCEMRLFSRTIECSSSAWSTTTPSLMDVYGPTKVSLSRQPAPMTTGPRTVQRSSRLPAPTTHRPLEGGLEQLALDVARRAC